MEAEEAATTLAARNEIRGRKYPMNLERFILILIAVLGIYIGVEVVQEDILPTWADVIFCLILLPLGVLVTAESVGRMIQKVIS